MLWLAVVLVGGVALMPRVLGLADFFTIDEGYHWVGRVTRFGQALAAGDWAATNQTGHPGVTTMWLGSLGAWLATLFGIADPGWAGGGAGYLGMLRLPIAIVNSLAVVSGYLLLRRLVRPPVALLGALFWAASPFLVAHSRLIHLDALVTSFMTLSLLALLVALWRHDDRPPTADHRPPMDDGRPRVTFSVLRSGGWLALSGACAGLALLTKGPGLVLLAFATLLFLADSRGRIVNRHTGVTWIRNLLIWFATALLVVVVLWPAIWVAPLHSVGSVFNEVIGNGGVEHHSGNFFLGQPVADPGVWFYPAVVLWRTTPWTLCGLAALAGVAILEARSARGRSRPGGTWLCGFSKQSRTLLVLALFVLFFTLLMSAAPKKFDRYLLPAWPALEILAAAGIVELARRGAKVWWMRSQEPAASSQGESESRRAGEPGSRGAGASENHGTAEPRNWEGRDPKSKIELLLWSLMVVLLAGNLAWYHPYYLAYFNPLPGGGAGAQRVLLVGWGEGLEEAGAWLRERPDLGRGPVLSWIPPSLAPFVPDTTLVLDLRPELLHKPSSYAVLYARSVQRQESAEAEAYVRQTPPLVRVQKYGIDYASIHQLPRPFDQAVDAVFGDGLHLRGFSQVQVGSTLVITPSWNIQTSQPGSRFVFVHVLDVAGRRVAQVDAPLDQGMFAEWQAGQQFDSPLPVALPGGLPAGTYQVVLGVYDPRDGSRLSVRGGQILPPALDGPAVLRLGALEIGPNR